MNSLGKFLRKLRIDNDEVLKDMANKLGVSSSYLSAVENGVKKLPQKWLPVIEKRYSLTDTQREELAQAYANTTKKIELNLKGVPQKKQELAFSFARKFSTLSDEELIAIQKIVEGEAV